MAKDRLQVRDLQGPQELRPTAAPVDIYHRPGGAGPNRGPSEMAQIAEALGQFSPTLYAIADKEHAIKTAADMSEGERAVLMDRRLQNRRALKEAVDRGDIPAARNPWFLEGMRKQVARIEGNEYDEALREAYAKSDSKNQDDISGFIQSFTEERLKALGADPSDPAVAEILHPAIERSQANLLSYHRQERDRAIEQQVIENTGIEITQALDRFDIMSDPNEWIVGQIHGIVDEQYKNGLPGTVTNEIIAKSIAEKARQAGDPDFLNLLDHIKTGTGTVGQIGWVKSLREQTEEAIYTNAHQHQERIRVADTQARKEMSQKLQAQAWKVLNGNPAADISAITSQLADVDFDKAKEIEAYQQTRIKTYNSVAPENELKRNDLTVAVYSGNGSVSAIQDALKAHEINGETADMLTSKIWSSAEFRSPIRDASVNSIYQNMTAAIRGSDQQGTPTDRINAARAGAQFLTEMDAWNDAHKDATGAERVEYAKKLQDLYLTTFSPAASKDAAKAVKELTPEQALVAPPESINPTLVPVYPDLKALEADAAASIQAGDGRFLQLAARFGRTPAEFLRDQRNAFNVRARTKPKTSTP